MARLITVDGDECELFPGRKHKKFSKREIHTLVGPGIGVFVVDASTVMLVNLPASQMGAALNIKAVRILRRSVIDPLAQVYGSVLLASYEEIEFGALVGKGFAPR